MLAAEHLINAQGLLATRKADLTLGQKAELIDATPWHNDFSFEQMKKLARYMDAYEVEADTVLFSEGERKAYLVLIASGSVDVVKFDSRKIPRKIVTLGRGKTIGEMSLIDGQPRSASALATSAATLLVMTAIQFEGLNQALPGIGITLALKIARQMSQYLRQTSGRLIDHLAEE